MSESEKLYMMISAAVQAEFHCIKIMSPEASDLLV